ncbi:MAG: alpha/beta hydrolase [Armatimonadota bacterium]|nr:alpha/beta hydrolase [bacterium]
MSKERLDFIHRFEPSKEHGDTRVLLLLHATGGDENQMVPIAHTLAPEATFLSPRGKIVENGNARFFRRFAEGVFDEEDLVFRTSELAEFVEKACMEYSLDCSNIIAIGYSNGANIAASLLLLQPQVLAGAVLFRPMVPLIPQKIPKLDGKRIFIAAGKSDPIVSVEQTMQLCDLLRQAGADVTLHWEDSGHAIVGGDIKAARNWMESR